MEIRELTDADVDTVLQMNEHDVHNLTSMDAHALARARDNATAIRVADTGGRAVGFAIVYGPHDDHRSVNFRWHRDEFTDFLYLDRIVVDADMRRQGIATALYDEIEQMATPHGRLVCEVHFEPPNEASLAFHGSRGYREIGTLTQPGGAVCVMLEKPLDPS